MRALATLAAGVWFGCSGDAPVIGPAISVMKETAANCFTVLTPVRPSTDLGLDQTLCEAAGAPTLIAGVDQIRLLIDYGNVHFDGTKNAPVPIVQVTADGRAVDASVTILPERRVAGHSYFVASLQAPTMVSDTVQFAAAVNPGFSTVESTIFRIKQPIQAVSVLKRSTRSGQSCSILVAGAEPSPDLGLPRTVSDGTGSAEPERRS
jgi:hypothetical protein